MKAFLIGCALILAQTGCSKKTDSEESKKSKEDKAMGSPMEKPKTDSMENPMEDSMGQGAVRPREEPPRREVLETTVSVDGDRIVVEKPTGDGWDCVKADEAGKGGVKAYLIKCRRANREEFYFMTAKEYTVPKSQVMSAEKLATKIYPKNYRKLFQKHRITKKGPVKFGEHKGFEIRLEAKHKTMGPIAKVERVFTKGESVFILSVEGKPEQVQKWSAAAEKWFSSTVFRELKK